MGNLTYSFFCTPHKKYVKKCGSGTAMALFQVLGSVPCDMLIEKIQKVEDAALITRKPKHWELFSWVAKRSKEVLSASPDLQFLIVEQWENEE